jgi:hypothetical protein
MSTINAITSPAPAIVTTVDSTGNLILQTAGTNAVTYDANQNATHTGYISAPNTFGYKNRVINGNMNVDQRNAGNSYTVPGGNSTAYYTVDRFAIQSYGSNVFTAQQNSGNAPASQGFAQCLKITTASAQSIGSTDYYALFHNIEGYNISDLGWGTSGAKTITLSFWVNCSLTGTFSGALKNSDASRSYVFSYTVNSANTWEFKTIVVPGDTAGTWQSGASIGISICLDLGAGSGRKTTAGSWYGSNYYGATSSVTLASNASATYYITGVQLEVGSKATPFDMREYGRELIMCQRYFEKSYDQGTAVGSVTDNGQHLTRATAQAGGSFGNNIFFKVEKRTSPTVTFYRASDGYVSYWSYNTSGGSNSTTFSAVSVASSQCRLNGAATISAFQAVEFYGHYTISAEL